jgi:hypothetical protein
LGIISMNMLWTPSHIYPCSGVELGSLSSLITKVQSLKTIILQWTWLLMGMRPSSFNAVRHYYWGDEFAETRTIAQGTDGVSGGYLGQGCRPVRLCLPTFQFIFWCWTDSWESCALLA